MRCGVCRYLGQGTLLPCKLPSGFCINGSYVAAARYTPTNLEASAALEGS